MNANAMLWTCWKHSPSLLYLVVPVHHCSYASIVSSLEDLLCQWWHSTNCSTSSLYSECNQIVKGWIHYNILLWTWSISHYTSQMSAQFFCEHFPKLLTLVIIVRKCCKFIWPISTYFVCMYVYFSKAIKKCMYKI